MRTIEVKLWDDLDNKRDRTRTPADVQVELTYVKDKRTRHVRLDLTTEHGTELDALLAPYLAAGQPADGAAPDGEHAVRNGGKIRRGPPGEPGSTEARRWRAQLRAWSDGLGLVNPDDPSFPAWKTVTDKHYYPADLEDAYLAHLAGNEEEAAALVARFKPQAV